MIKEPQVIIVAVNCKFCDTCVGLLSAICSELPTQNCAQCSWGMRREKIQFTASEISVSLPHTDRKKKKIPKFQPVELFKVQICLGFITLPIIHHRSKYFHKEIWRQGTHGEKGMQESIFLRSEQISILATKLQEFDLRKSRNHWVGLSISDTRMSDQCRIQTP